MLKDFKAFIARGNVLDLAVGIIIGAAFSSIVSSLVDNVIMPLIGLLMGGIDFSSLSIIVGDAVIEYGIFIQRVVDFLIIAFSIFLFIRVINSFKKKQAETEEEVVEEIDEQTKLLTEIRDLLKEM
ncbi:MAG: large-conductance mechanosensitive channel protein MscL [Amphibacillus sp.]|uniref:Large-conductance mechanosensitive channel n=1 Tax=Amphibacillus xylanus (strain ATCC 51415 / DSM 6626 / JCM 7361 / LMG 17667 / NBRC 15112 / Ep01) TaxID=698758 RepID=K0J5I9_AMPXN|nr:large-conductance mechanosensitive channel protein MscL [Amphibacillus xylanus]NMA90599.1 large-conductance mechanosensitive channel protein MscL [Amphibacillus sp.]BAM48231.1 large-conductance mechanosensitive channel [Amphibacillus xylanus NBRC 15112]